MARNAGIAAYHKKTVRRSVVITRAAWLKIRAAVRRTGKSESDIINHAVMEAADAITASTPRFGDSGYKEAEGGAH